MRGPNRERACEAGKQPYAIALADRALMALAGHWEMWRSPAGERLRSFAIITTRANELCVDLHDRMPVILSPQSWPAWLGEEPADPARLKSMLAPYPSDEMTCWPVSPRVAMSNRGLMALAPLWEIWRSPASERVRSFAIITTRANELCAELHDRMPVILSRESLPAWLGEEPADPACLKAMLAPVPSDEMTCRPVSPRVAMSKTTIRA